MIFWNDTRRVIPFFRSGDVGGGSYDANKIGYFWATTSGLTATGSLTLAFHKGVVSSQHSGDDKFSGFNER